MSLCLSLSVCLSVCLSVYLSAHPHKRYIQRCGISRNFRNSGYWKICPSLPETLRKSDEPRIFPVRSGQKSSRGKFRKFCQALVASLYIVYGSSSAFHYISISVCIYISVYLSLFSLHLSIYIYIFFFFFFCTGKCVFIFGLLLRLYGLISLTLMFICLISSQGREPYLSDCVYLINALTLAFYLPNDFF